MAPPPPWTKFVQLDRPTRDGRRKTSLLGWMGVGVWVLASASLHQWAGLTLPLPVGDEVAFYWPSLALAERGTLLAPALNPHRVLEWMPPGYMTTLAGWILLAGPGLVSARWLSWGLSVVALGLWGLVIRDLLSTKTEPGSLGRWVWPSALMLTLWAGLSRHWLVMGNMARMEGLLLVVALLGWRAALAGRWLGLLALWALSLLVHPNGIYFGLIGVGLWFWRCAPPFSDLFKLRIPSPRLWEGLLALLAGVLWGAYLSHVVRHWEAFVHDWQHQLSLRSRGGLSLLLWRPDTALFLVLWAGSMWALWRGYAEGRGGVMALLALAMGLFVIRIVGQGWVYGVFSIMAVTVTAAVAVALGARWITDMFLPGRTMQVWGISLLAAGGVGLPLVAGGVLSVPFVALTYEWQGMRPTGFSYQFITDEDRSSLNSILNSLPRQDQTRTPVYVIEAGEGIVLNPRDEGAWQSVLPAFGGTLPRYYLIHQSHLNAFNQATIAETLEVLQLDTLPAPVYTRDAERWYLLEAPREGRSGSLPLYIRSMQNGITPGPAPKAPANYD